MVSEVLGCAAKWLQAIYSEPHSSHLTSTASSVTSIKDSKRTGISPRKRKFGGKLWKRNAPIFFVLGKGSRSVQNLTTTSRNQSKGRQKDLAQNYGRVQNSFPNITVTCERTSPMSNTGLTRIIMIKQKKSQAGLFKAWLR